MIRQAVFALIKRIFRWAELFDEEEMKARIAQLRRKGARIGNNVRLIGRIDGLNPHLVTIGDSCVIGLRSALLTHCAIRGARPVVIEDEVWIGFNALVLPGVTVGTQSVIGAGAVVTKDVPPRSIVAGNPARVLRSLTDGEAKELARQLRGFMAVGEDPDRPGAASGQDAS